MPTTPEFLRELREAHDTYRHLVEGIPAIVYVDAVDDRSTTLYISPHVHDVLGISPSEWQRDPGLWVDRLHPDDRDRVVAEHRECNRTGDPFHVEYRSRAQDGRVVWIRDDAVLVRDDDGAPAFWRGVMVDVTERRVIEERLRRSVEALRATMEDRRRLLMLLEGAQDGERRRIAADIHDDSIQVMTAADIQVQGIVDRLEDPDLRSELEGLRATLQEAVERLRHLLFELRPPSLDREGLVSALRSYTSGLAGPEVAVRATLDAEPPPDVGILLYRIAQEAITNARKHARATRIDVTLEPNDGGVLLRVRDDGEGFDIAIVDDPPPGHIGLGAMIERAELAGGRLRIDSARGSGTGIDVWLPAAPLGA
ncbi:MAG: sensor histidine kinase [Actinomycetota bacterium]